MFDLRSGLPYFWVRNGLPYLYPALERDERCDVVVVGAGITGALCAHALASAGIGTVVVDAHSAGTASTGASTSLLQYEIDTPLHELIDRVGERTAVRSYELCLESIDAIGELAARTGHGGFIRRHSLQYASHRSHVDALRKEHAVRTAHGFQVDLLERADLKRIVPFSAPLALMSHAAAEIDAYAFTHALLQDVLRMGGRVYERSEVKRFGRSGDDHELRTTEGHRIHAKHVVMATGYASQQYLPAPVIDLDSTYALASERMGPGPLWHQDCLIWETAQPYLYLRTTPDGRVIIGGLDEPFSNAVRRDRLLDRKTRRLTRAFHKLFPKLPFKPEYAWCGTFGTTKDGLPYIDRDPSTGAWFVLGMGGNGITFSQVGAVLVRDAILGRANSDAALFRFDR